MQMIWGMWTKGQKARGDHTPKQKVQKIHYKVNLLRNKNEQKNKLKGKIYVHNKIK